LALIDDAIADLLPVARDHSRVRYSVEAWGCICRWSERKARLLGLDAPVKKAISILTDDAVQAEIVRLQAMFAIEESQDPEEVRAAARQLLALPPGQGIDAA
jgi:hypothetical protein